MRLFIKNYYNDYLKIFIYIKLLNISLINYKIY